MDNLSYSDYGFENRALFLSDFNDINIYVEDEGKEYEYEEILERLFEGEIKIFSIFPLGGKSQLIKKHNSCNLMDDNGKLNVFIADGDFDNIWQEDKIISDNFIYLERYNIESYYCSKNAVIKFMRGFMKKQRKIIESEIQFDEWETNFIMETGELFALFAIAKKYKLEIENVKKARGTFMDEKGNIHKDKYINYRQKIENSLGELAPYINDVKNRIENNFLYDKKCKFNSIICGKYKIEAICRKLKTHCEKDIDRKYFVNSLISNFDISTLFFLKQKIINLISDNYI